ncbi:MAG TPA: LacI family transcriptional regulator [Arsenicitalea sp.]|nr:LacI family transcriptional regulator [Arsenicitalea sp.]
MQGKPTLKTIAEMTGLAVTTISRALNNAPELAQETRERVQRIAAEIGYLPDRAALRLKTGRTNVISLILDPHDEILGFGQSMVNGLTTALRDTPYHLIITPNYRNVAPIDPVRHILRNRMADGIIFSRTEPQDERVLLCLENNFPFVSHGRTELPTPHPYVDYDNFAFAYAATKRLAGKGRKKLGIILPPTNFTFGHHLRDGFMSAVRELGLDYEISETVTLDSNADDIRLAIMARIDRPDAPDGYICSGDAAGLAVMAGISDAGKEIGDDIDVIVKQTSPIFSLVRPRVDAIYEDTALAGEQIGRLLIRRIAGEAAEGLQFLDRPDVRF